MSISLLSNSIMGLSAVPFEAIDQADGPEQYWTERHQARFARSGRAP